ncbi:MAG: sigma-70 family RNA polymerase sigma factor [Kiritimatiellales bacterium]
MTDDNDGDWRETFFTPEQWACVPASKRMGYRAESDQDIDERLRAAEEIGLVVQAIMLSALTSRQRQVMELYYLENLTQIEVAAALGITQVTVSQHLKGKQRNGKPVGGAFRKIRKAIHKAALSRVGDESRYASIIAVLDALLDASLTRRRARHILGSLSPGVRSEE